MTYSRMYASYNIGDMTLIHVNTYMLIHVNTCCVPDPSVGGKYPGMRIPLMVIIFHFFTVVLSKSFSVIKYKLV